MSAILTRVLAVLGALLVLGVVNASLFGKEKIRRDGATVYLALAPVDPRSLMQGDYMALRFELAQELERQLGPVDTANATAREGETRRAAVALDERQVARLGAGDASAALTLRYRIRAGRVWLGTNAFFFEEGSAARFANARFGEFRVDRASGEAVLVGLRDGALRAL
ncbi:MAG TPA: GDYXXLXY domain-containing protein [Burkholderiaceae bacterium]|nr:GDYXXLXY domain-containing protein [Burkholderiaceae bacterium]